MTTISAWPFPGDTALLRARRIALAYREHLRNLNPQLCAAIDESMRAYGQTWIAPEADPYDDYDAITTAEAAQLVDVSQETIRQWACTPHPVDPTRMLLPRFGWRARQRTYLVVHVWHALELARERPVRALRDKSLSRLVA